MRLDLDRIDQARLGGELDPRLETTAPGLEHDQAVPQRGVLTGGSLIKHHPPGEPAVTHEVERRLPRCVLAGVVDDDQAVVGEERLCQLQYVEPLPVRVVGVVEEDPDPGHGLAVEVVAKFTVEERVAAATARVEARPEGVAPGLSIAEVVNTDTCLVIVAEHAG